MVAELAMRAMMILARRHGEGPIRLHDICAERSMSRDYLAKILGNLARVDLVTPVRGKHGGYKLARRPEQITVLEVIEAIEGPLALNLCQHDPPRCEEYDCKLRPVWRELQEAVTERFGRLTLAACVAETDSGQTDAAPD